MSTIEVMVRQGVWVLTCSLVVAVGSGSCGDDTGSGRDGLIKPDLAVSDITQTDAPRDALTIDAPVDVPLGTDAPQFQDSPYPMDAMSPDGPLYDFALQSCTTHCDCPQEWFCYYGSCIRDPKMPVYCCAKSGCPPGQWCIDTSNNKSVCPEDVTHPCTDACDCGPAHCCIDVPSLGGKRCVKHTNDPYMPGGTAIGGASCKIGLNIPQDQWDATYCASDPICHAGKAAWAASGGGGMFRAYNRDQQQSINYCGSKPCFGTACNCASGESCVDTSSKVQEAGKTCYPLSGGACISNAMAEAVYGWGTSDLLPCCSPSCSPGQQCEVGWRTDGEYAYARVVGVCEGTCGNGSCDPGESASSCAADCTFPLIGTSKCDGRNATIACPLDCPGKALGNPSKEACCVSGVCIGPGCPIAGCP